MPWVDFCVSCISGGYVCCYLLIATWVVYLVLQVGLLIRCGICFELTGCWLVLYFGLEFVRMLVG